MPIVDMNGVVAQTVTRFCRNKVMVVSDSSHKDDIQIEIISAKFVQRQKTESIAEMGDVILPFPPVVAVIPFLQQSPGNVVVQIESYELNVVVFLL
jgi:hypothetical protein